MQINISTLQSGKKVYFASDFHLGAPNDKDSLIRERKIVAWLDSIRSDAQQVFLVGDLFDFWFEYRHVAPKGHLRFLGKLAELSDQGIELIIFCGNHDLWFSDYLKKELNAEIVHSPISVEIGQKKFYVAHGDGLGSGVTKFKIIKWFFTNPLCQWLFRWVHPNIGFGLAKFWSSLSRDNDPDDAESQKLMAHSRTIEDTQPHDFYIFGHCHSPSREKLTEKATYVNLGDWIQNYTYGEFDGSQLKLEIFKG